MSKYSELKKRIVKESAVAGAIIVLVGAVAMGVTEFSDASIASRAEAESALSAANAKVAGLKDQIGKSSSAEKRYADIRLMRSQENYASDTEALKELIRYLKEKYRLTNNFKLTLPSGEVKSDRTEFSALNFDVMVRDDTEIIFGAMSDVHVFSFLDEFLRSSPGIVRLTKFNMTRKSPMDVNTLSQMTSGAVPEVITVEMHFLWAGLKPKDNTTANTGAPAAPGAPL